MFWIIALETTLGGAINVIFVPRAYLVDIVERVTLQKVTKHHNFTTLHMTLIPRSPMPLYLPMEAFSLDLRMVLKLWAGFACSTLLPTHCASILIFTTFMARVNTKFHAMEKLNMIGTRVTVPSCTQIRIFFSDRTRFSRSHHHATHYHSGWRRSVSIAVVYLSECSAGTLFSTCLSWKFICPWPRLIYCSIRFFTSVRVHFFSPVTEGR